MARRESDKAVNWSAISVGGMFSEHSRQSQLEQQQEMQRQYLALQQQRLLEEQRRQAELIQQQQKLYEQRMLEHQQALELEERKKQMEAELLRQQYEEALQRQRLAEQERLLQEQERQLAIQRQQEILRAQQLAIQQQRLEHEQRQREIAEMERQAALKAEAARLQQQLEQQRVEEEWRAEEERRAAAVRAEQERVAQKLREQAELERLAQVQQQLEAEARRKQQEIERAAVEAQRRAEEQKRALEAAQLEAQVREEEHRRELARRAEMERQYAAAVERQRQEEEERRAEEERRGRERAAEKERRRREREEREREELRRAMQLHGPRAKQHLSRQEILNQRKMMIAHGLLDPNAPYDDAGEGAGADAGAEQDSIFSKLNALADDHTSASPSHHHQQQHQQQQQHQTPTPLMQQMSPYLRTLQNSTSSPTPSSPPPLQHQQQPQPSFQAQPPMMMTMPMPSAVQPTEFRMHDFQFPSAESPAHLSSSQLPAFLSASQLPPTATSAPISTSSSSPLSPSSSPPQATSSSSSALPLPALQRPKTFHSPSRPAFEDPGNNTFLTPEFLDQSKEDLPPRGQEITHELGAAPDIIDVYPVINAATNPFAAAPETPPAPVQTVLSVAQVFNSYHAEDASELTITEDETIEVLHKFDNGWWIGRNAFGATGTFPSNFVKELPHQVEDHHNNPFSSADVFAPSASASSSSSSPTPMSSSSNAASSSPPMVNRSAKYTESSPAAMMMPSPFPDTAASSSGAGGRTDSSLEILFHTKTAVPKPGGTPGDSLEEVLASLKFADEEQAKRTKVIFEILDSERSYVHGLQTLAQVYMDPLLLSLKTSKPVVKERDLKAIFPHVTVILSHNQIFLKELEDRVAKIIAESTPPRLGDLFLRLKDYLHAYSSYVNSYPQANNTLQNLMKSSPKLVQFLNQAKSNPACNSWDLPTFLILPIQRVPRYILLVQELLKYTPPEHIDYNDLVAALVSLRDIADLINESKRDAENLPEVLRVYNAVEPRIANLVEPHRRFVMEGMVYEVKKKHLKQRYIFLFNDLLLLTDRKIKKDKKGVVSAPSSFSSRLVANIPLGSANLDTSNELKGWKFPPEATEMLPNAFILHASKSSYLFFAPTSQKKGEWISSLTKSIQFAAARTKSLGL